MLVAVRKDAANIMKFLSHLPFRHSSSICVVGSHEEASGRLTNHTALGVVERGCWIREDIQYFKVPCSHNFATVKYK